MFKKYFILLVVVSLLIPASAQEIKFGVITDVHRGYLTDAELRLQIFIDAVTKEEVDFIIQLGDFTLYMNDEKSGNFLDIWNSFDGPAYHVLGNHDMDKNTKQEAVDYLGMESKYYSFDMLGFHFVVMDDNHIKLEDGSFVDYDNGNIYNGANKDWFGDEQLLWLEEDLANTDLATVVFRHAGILGKQQGSLESIISNANSNAGFKKVLLGLNGHGHDDDEKIADNVPYVEIPSASYIWNNHQAEPYTKVQFAIVTINTANGTLVIDGRSEDVDYQEGLPTHEPVITDKSYAFSPIGIRSSFSFSTDDCSAIASFTNTSSESATFHYWNFGDGQSSTEESPTHIYNQSGSYAVQLAISSDGVSGHISSRIIAVNFAEKPSGTDGNRNGAGTVDLSASVSDGGTISWYDVAVGGTALGTGTSFTTPELSETTNYYAENKIDSCISERDTVVAYINPAVGTGDANADNRINIYPNPTNGIVNISIDRSFENLNVNVYNTNGQCVKTEKFDHPDGMLLNLTDLPEGMYVIKLVEKDNILVETSIIKGK